MYNTCLNMCLYCYANYAERQVHGNYAQARSGSPLQIGVLGKGDVVVERTRRHVPAQLSLFGNEEA
jgi:DNA repair photolyase